MKEKINTLKSMEFKEWSLLIAIIADCIYILNLILCLRKYSKLNASNPEKEKGMTEYISSHQTGQILFMIGIVLLIIATVLLFTQYIREKDGILKIISIICLISMLFYTIALFLEIIFEKLDIYYYNSLIMQLIAPIITYMALISLLISFIVFIFNADYRTEMLMLIASAIWFAVGEYIIMLGIGIIVISILGAIFNSNDDVHELREYDGKGNLIGRWIKKD